MAEAFVYCWTDHKTKKLYVGSHSGNNNNAVAIETPYGFFGSIMEASKYLHIKYDNVWYKLRSNKPVWRRI